MNLQQRIDLLVRLGEYILSDDERWHETKKKAHEHNGWFIPSFIDVATNNISKFFLQKNILQKWIENYSIPDLNKTPKKIGITMAGNIPLVGFHDLLSVFITGHHALLKLSSKDEILLPHLVNKLAEWNASILDYVRFEGMLKGCDAYIATGSNNSSRYFEYYFAKYPHIIRRNRTSVAILDGNETPGELEKLADDVHLYFGLGCRNVTKLYVPEKFDFVPLLNAFRNYSYFSDHHKYKNNYDYNLALHLLNNRFYMTNNSLLLVEDSSVFSPISQLNYEYYKKIVDVKNNLLKSTELQSIVGHSFVGFGKGQSPAINDYADGVDTLRFLTTL